MDNNTVPAGLKAFLDAMHTGDIQGVSDRLAENVTLRSPIVVEPFVGHDQVMSILSYLLDIADEFNVIEILTGEDHFAVLLAIRVGSTEVDGVDYMHLDDNGMVDSLMIMWRPLPAVVAVQNRLAPVIGIPPLALTPMPGSNDNA